MYNEIAQYAELNKIAEPKGIVIFGGTADKAIPLCELKQAFGLNSNLYNRSIENLSLTDAESVYTSCISPIHPESILLHIGECDINLFSENPAKFDNTYRELINTIKDTDKHCNIVIISLKNPDNNTVISEINKHLRYIADSEHCEYGDITSNRVWNPKETKDVISFIYSLGFVHPLNIKRPIYDLTKILFCYNTCNRTA
ncbi:MAG: hypothetical protein IJ316_02740 [Clostridia bacterium]|nr:hypothetical protein [Clostridia bacterium]